MQSSIACSGSSDISVLLWLLCLMNCCVSRFIATWFLVSCVLSSIILNYLIIESGCFPSRRFWGTMNSGFANDWEHRGGSQISTEREDVAHGSAGIPKLSECLEIALSDFEGENAMVKGDHLRQVVEIVIGGVPVDVEVCFMCLFMSLGRLLLQGSVSTNLFYQMWNKVDLWKVEVTLQLLGNGYLMADMIPRGDRFRPHLGRRQSCSICFLIYLLLLCEFSSQGISFGLPLFVGAAEYKNICECVRMTQGVLHVAQCCIIVTFIASIHIEF